ncbi:MAG: hypothetical protein QM775_28410 [Pirellulales bacterium]
MRYTLDVIVEEVVSQLRHDGWMLNELAINSHWEVKGKKDAFVIEAVGVSRYSSLDRCYSTGRVIADVLGTMK